jgi:1,4-dihydroxy-2-naphthoate octaprenyltransferase
MSCRQGKLNKIIGLTKAIRIHIVAGGLLAYSLGVLLGLLNMAAPNPSLIIMGYLVVLFGDLSTHYSNDYFDANKNWQDKQRKFFGGSDVLFKHPEIRPLARANAIALSLLSITVAAIAHYLCGAPAELLVIAIIANLLGWFYSAPPACLVSRGLGELAIAIGTGLLIPGAGYLMSKGYFDPFFLSFAVPFTLYGFILSLSLEAPDMEEDVRMGKNNLVVRIGRHSTFLIIMLFSFLSAVAFGYNVNNVATIDYKVVTGFSCVPLITGLGGFVNKHRERSQANLLGALNVAALFLFNIFLNGYFAVLLFT